MGGALSWLLAGALVAAAFSALRHGRRAVMAAATTPTELALLDRPIEQVDLGNVPLARGLDAMARGAQTRVSIHWPSIEAERRSARMPCSIHLGGVRLGPAVRMEAFARESSGCLLWPYRAEPSQVWADARAVHIGLVSVVPRVVRAYPVAGLLRGIEEDLRHEEAESQPSLNSAPVTGGVGAGSLFQAPTARQELVQFIEDTACSGDWVDNGGTLGDLTVVSDRLWVFQTQEGHAAVRAMLALFADPAVGGPPSPHAPAAGDENAHANLEQLIPELKLESSTLEGAIDAVRQATHANILVYWEDLLATGLRRETPIKLHLWSVTLDHALGAILTVAGGEYPAMRAVRDGMIVISSPEEIRDGSASVRVYDIRDLIEKYLKEGRLALAYPTTGPTNRELAAQPGTYQDTVDSIAKLIEDTVDTDSWKDNGGSIGALRELAGRLIITQTPSAHKKIAALLRTLREGGSKEGTEVPGDGK